MNNILKKPKILPTLLKINMACLGIVFISFILLLLYLGSNIRRYERVSEFLHDYADLYQYGVTLVLRIENYETDSEEYSLAKDELFFLSEDMKKRMLKRRSHFEEIYDSNYITKTEKILSTLVNIELNEQTDLKKLTNLLEESYFDTLVLSSKHQEKMEERYIKTISYSSFIFLIFIFLVLVVLAKKIKEILGPLKDLTKASEKLSISDEKLDINLNHKYLEYQTLALSFRDMYQRITYENRVISNQSTNSSISYFVENIAHAINNPLATIATSMALIKKKCIKSNDDFLLGEVQICDDQINRITDITHKMKSLISSSSKVEASKFNISNVTTFVNLLFFNRFLDGNMKFISPKDEISIFGKEEIIINIIVTLIENAVTYNDNAEPIIEFGIRTSEDKVILFVYDNGTPVPSIDIYQYLLGSGNRSSISLFTARKLAEDSGYNLYYNEEPKKEFILEIPQGNKYA